MSAVLVFRCFNSIPTVFWLSCFSVYSTVFSVMNPETWVLVKVCLCFTCYSTFDFSKTTLDVVDSSLWSELSSDAQEFEAESWSLVVDPSFCSRQEKDVIKRQDVIFGKLFRYAPWMKQCYIEGKTWTLKPFRPEFKSKFYHFLFFFKATFSVWFLFIYIF